MTNINLPIKINYAVTQMKPEDLLGNLIIELIFIFGDDFKLYSFNTFLFTIA